MWRSNHCWCLQGQLTERSGALDGVPGPFQNAAWPISVPAPATLAELLFPLGWMCHFWGGAECTLKRNRSSLDPILRSSTLEPRNTILPINRAMLATEHQRSPNSQLVHDPAPPAPAPLLTKKIASSTAWGRHDPCSSQIHLSHQNHWAHRDCI